MSIVIRIIEVLPWLKEKNVFWKPDDVVRHETQVWHIKTLRKINFVHSVWYKIANFYSVSYMQKLKSVTFVTFVTIVTFL